MSKFLAVASDKALTGFAKMLAKTGCMFWCHRLETPDELL
jgi:cyclic lactone autoinducer peptide